MTELIDFRSEVPRVVHTVVASCLRNQTTDEQVRGSERKDVYNLKSHAEKMFLYESDRKHLLHSDLPTTCSTTL
jgi:hypothetical protein